MKKIPLLRNRLIDLLAFVTVVMLSGCVENQGVGVGDHTGYTELKYPNNSYAPGQIVERYKKPNKVEITYIPVERWKNKKLESPGWEISSGEIKNIKANIAADVAEKVSTSASRVSEENIQVGFTNMKTILVPKSEIYKTLKSEISQNKTLQEQLIAYKNEKVHFDVLTMVLTGTISFKLVGSSGTSWNAKTEKAMIDKLNADLEMDFSRDTQNNRFISGKNLVLGIHFDTKMIDILMKKLNLIQTD